jgi:hypothetical protein
MDADEIIKHAPEIAKGAGALAAAVPFTAIVKRMLGPAADEVAEMWADKVRLYRAERQASSVKKAERFLTDAGINPATVSLKLLFPLLEGASFEEDENLHDMWAALLANAASPENAAKVRPGFIAILKQMTRDEGRLLNWIFDQQGHPAVRISALVVQHSRETTPSEALPRSSSDEGPSELGICLNGLEASFLIQMHNFKELSEPHYALTARGYAFVTACRPPKRK